MKEENQTNNSYRRKRRRRKRRSVEGIGGDKAIVIEKEGGA